MDKIRYGIDAPKVIQNLIGVGAAVLLLVVLFPVIELSGVKIDMIGFVWMGISLIFTGILMILYSMFGKFKHRDRILNLIDWKGDERVLSKQLILEDK